MLRRSTRRRHGAALVEFAAVAIVFFMFLFAIFEFAYLVMVRNLMDNAVREGARYAAVNTNQGSALLSQVRDVVDIRMRQLTARMTGYSKTTSITMRALNPVTGAQLTSGGSNVNPWDTSFGHYIEVRVDTTYRFMMPSLLSLPASMSMSASAVTNSEAN